MIRKIDEHILPSEDWYEFRKDPEEFSKKRKLDIKDFVGEEWKPIEGYGGFYLISNYGRVKSLERVGYKGRVYPSKIMSTRWNGKTQLTMVKLSKDGKQRTHYIEKLMEEYFPTEIQIEKKKKLIVIKEKEKKEDDISLRRKRAARYCVVNTFTNEKFYATRKDEIETRIGLSSIMIDRIVENQYRDPRGYKIYLTEKGALEHSGKRKPLQKRDTEKYKPVGL